MSKDKSISKLISDILPLGIEERLPLWLLTVIVTSILTSLGFLLGVYIHPLMTLLFSSVPIYPFYLSLFKAQQHRRAILLVFVWAITISLNIIILTLGYATLASKAVISGASYQEEMFLWIATGVGPEGNPSAFVPEHLMNAALFSTFSLATAGILALVFGAYQMNYMNFYVGVLFSRVEKPTFTNLVMVALLSWPIYAIIRVVGFILIGVATTIPLANTIFDRKVETRALLRFLLVGTIFVGIDIVIKAIVAPFYRDLLNELVIA